MHKVVKGDDIDRTAAIDMAHRVAWQLRELAKLRGYDPKGIKVLTTGRSCDKVRADAQVIWKEGPDNWAREIQVYESVIVCVEPTSHDILSFYII